MAVPREEGFRT